MKLYYIHDNGSRPFKVEVDNIKKKCYVYHLKNDLYDLKGEWIQGEYEENYCLKFNFKKIWIGQDSSVSKKFGVGNSILLQIGNRDYVHIGSEIYSFKVKIGEKITKFFSPIGNNDVSYPYAVGILNTYILIENKYVKNKERKEIGEKLIDDPYQHYFGLEKPQFKSFRFKTKLLHERIL
jgi:hypothetical protein